MADIEITGSARGAVAAVETARRSLQQLASTAPTASESARWKASADNINAWKRAASGVAPQLTGLIDSMEEFAEGAEKVGGSAMASRVALLALGTAATAAAAAVVAAGTAIVASSIEVIAHLEDYNDVATRHRAALDEAADAYDGLGRSIRTLRVEVAGQLAPQLQWAFDLVSGGIIIINEAVTAFDGLAGAISTSVRAVSGLIPGMTFALGVLDTLVAVGRTAREGTDFGGAGEGAGGSLGAALAAASSAASKFRMDIDAAEQAQSQLLRGTWENATRAAPAATAAIHAEAAATKALEMATWDASEAVKAFADQQAADAARNMPDANKPSTIGGGVLGGGVDWWNTTNPEESPPVKAAKATEGAWVTSLTGILGAASSVFGAIAELSQSTTRNQIGDLTKLSAEQRHQMYKHWKAQKALAISQALINGAVAFTSALQTQPIYVGIALAAATAVMTGVQVAAIARQQPSFHRGGMWAPDERMGPGGSKVLASERMAIYPARSAPSEADVARVSTGERSSPDGGGIMPTITLMLDGVRTAWRQHAGPSAGYSPGRMAYGV